MRMLNRIVYVLLGIVLLLAVGGVMLPRQVQVQRSLAVDAPAAVVFPYINDFRLFNQWSPWARRDPQTRYEFSEPAAGEGASMRWQSGHPRVGQGVQTITHSEPPYRVRSHLELGTKGEDAEVSIRLEPDQGLTRVTWVFQMDFGMDLMGRYLGLLLDAWVGGDYEPGLRMTFETRNIARR